MKCVPTSIALSLLLAACATTPNEPDGGLVSRAEAPKPTTTAPLISRPEAPKPTPVQPEMRLVFEAVFAPQKTVLSRDSKAQLAELAGMLQRQAAAEITITGHANENGTEEYRIAIAVRRAEAVKQALVMQGFPADRITTLGSPERTWVAPAECKGKKTAAKNPACVNPGSPALLEAVLRPQQ